VAAEALEEGALLGDYSGEEGEEMDDEPLTGIGGSRIESPGVVRRSSSSGSGT